MEDHKSEAKEFTASHGLTSAEAATLLVQYGRNELEEKTTPSWVLYLQQLYQPMPIMIWIAIVIEGAIENWADFGILLGIQFINATLGWYETQKAGDAVAALKASLKPQATAKRDGTWINLDAAVLVPGDLVLLASGSAVPADCLVNHGQVDIDQAALTGESLPVTMHKGDSCKMGSTAVRGEVEATVEFTGTNTFFGKTASMLQVGGNELGHLQKILLTIMVVLVVISFVLCITAFGYLLGHKEKVREAISFTVVLLVASIPIAIEIVCTTTLALGSRQLSAHGAIVTRLAAIEDMAGMNMLCSDKTGTLTLNKMVIQDDTPVFTKGLDQKSLLLYGALAAKWKEPPRDALDTLVLTTVDHTNLEPYTQLDFTPFDPTVKRTASVIRGPDGNVFRVTKGAPHVLLELTTDAAVRHACEVSVTSLGNRGIRALAVAKSDSIDGPWYMLGLLTFLDPPRPDTKETIHKAMAYGVDVKMITGDHILIAKETSRMLGLGVNIQDPTNLPTMDPDRKVLKDLGEKYGKICMEADGFAQVYPEHKYLIVEALRQSGFAVGMTGDGVNDAPALKRADVGVAVQGATDAARAAADIVLTEPGLSTIVEGIIIARQIFQRMKNFINYRIAATLQLLCFFFIAVFALEPKSYAPIYTGPFGISHGCVLDETAKTCFCPEYPYFIESKHHGAAKFYCSKDNVEWPNFFSLPVIMLMLITLLNDGTLISIGYDNVKPSAMPEKWNLKALFCISSVLGGVACGSSLLLLWAALDSWNPDGIYHKWGMGPMPYGHVVTSIYLKVSISDFLTLFSARTHDGFFWSAAPSKILLGAASVALAISTALGCGWPEGETDRIPTMGLARGEYSLMPLWIWIYCVIWWFIQDGLKVLGYLAMHKYNIFNINNSSSINMRDANVTGDAPLARVSVGLVENKLLNAKVEDAIHKVEEVVRKGGPLAGANLGRVSTSLVALKKQSEIQRMSAGVGGPQAAGGQVADLESAGVGIEQVVAGLEDAASHAQLANDVQRGEINAAVREVRRAAEKLAQANTAASNTK